MANQNDYSDVSFKRFEWKMEGSVSNQVNFSEKEMMKYSRNIAL